MCSHANATILPMLSDDPAVVKWFDELCPEARRELVHLFDQRHDSFELACVASDDGTYEWRRLPLEAMPEVDRKEPASRPWHQELYEYLAAHPEDDLARQYTRRTFHLCTSHPVALAALRAGVIPHDFRCPFKDDACPMRRRLAENGGQSVALSASSRIVLQAPALPETEAPEHDHHAEVVGGVKVPRQAVEAWKS
jgi:hypothetical protein